MQNRRDARANHRQQTAPFETLVAAAEAKQQQAERRSAVALYDEAISMFERALSSAGDPTTGGRAAPDEVQNATVLLAEAIQNKCELFLKLWEAEGQHNGGTDPLGLLGEYTAEHEAAVFGQASELLRASALRYKSSGGLGSSLPELRVDALVNLGNTLSLWATVAADPGQVDALHREALECYDHALAAEDDATTRNNKGDALIAYAEFLAEHGRADDAQGAYEEALLAYDRAVQQSDSQKGDNLPMLLLDYGSALLSMAEFCFRTRRDVPRAGALLDEAEKRLAVSVSFGRGSAAVHTALGEVYLLGGEMQNDMSSLDKAGEAFAAALRIQRTDADGLIGAAETAVLKSKRPVPAADASTGTNSDTVHLSQAADLYRSAFASGTFSGTLKDKADTLYNYACCLSALPQGADEAVRILSTLISRGLVTREEARADLDLPDHVRSRL